MILFLKKSDKLIVTESAIDALSVATLRNEIGDVHYLSAGGVYINKPLIVTLPKALVQYLKGYNEIKNITVCLDNDDVGIKASQSIVNKLINDGYAAVIFLPKTQKDYNEYIFQK